MDARVDAHSVANGGIAVVLPTRDRGDSVRRPIQSLLASTRQPCQIVVVDQSSDERTRACLADPISAGRVTYLSRRERGLSRALNAGVQETTAAVIAITGDDCEVSSDWLDVIHERFVAVPDLGVLFGRVEAGRHDNAVGFVQAYGCERRVVVRHVRGKSEVGGTSACMAIRRDTFARLHGFDVHLGVGAKLRAAEETDFAIRALRAGIAVMEEPCAVVTHHGFMTWEQLPALVERNWFGTGAAMGKLLKTDPLSGMIVLVGLARRWVAGTRGVAATLGPSSHRGRRLVAFGRGVVSGLRYPVDRRTAHFLPIR